MHVRRTLSQYFQKNMHFAGLQFRAGKKAEKHGFRMTFPFSMNLKHKNHSVLKNFSKNEKNSIKCNYFT